MAGALASFLAVAGRGLLLDADGERVAAARLGRLLPRAAEDPERVVLGRGDAVRLERLRRAVLQQGGGGGDGQAEVDVIRADQALAGLNCCRARFAGKLEVGSRI